MSENLWQEFRLSQVGTVVTGGTPDTQNTRYWGGNIPFATPADFFGSLRLNQTERYLTAEGARSVGSFPKDSVLVTCIGTIGKIKITNCESGANQQINALICNKEFDPEFVANAISIRSNQLVALSGATTLSIVNGKSFASLKIACPNYAIQRRIAEILSTLDEEIEQTEALIAKYQQIKAGLMHDLFTRGVTPDGKLRPTRAEAPQLYKESPLGWIPKEWEVESLGNLSQFITSGSRGWAEYYSDSGPLFLRISNLTREHINFRWDEVTRVNLPKSTEGQRTAIRPSDILISITADLGIIAVARDDIGEAYVNQHIALVRPNVEPVLSRFIGHCLSTVRLQKQFLRFNDSGAKAGLNLPAVGKILVTMPRDDRETIGIAAMLDQIDQSVECYKRELAKLRQQKHGLMHDLLTGRVRVRVADS